MATNNKNKPLTDDEVLPLVEAKVRRGVGYLDSRLSTERGRVIKYYNSELPARQNIGRSSYISTDVYDAVESMKAQLLEPFAGNPDGLVSFPPQKPEDLEACQEATEYCSYQVFRLNPGYDVFSHVIHDGLTARVGITKVFWETIKDTVEETFENVPEQDAHALASQEDVEEFDAEEHEYGAGVYRGKLKRVIDRSKVTLLPVPPEEFVIEKSTRSIPTSGMVCHRTLKTKPELLDEGYDKVKVEKIEWTDARSLDLTEEKLDREKPTSDSTGAVDDAVQKELEKVMLYETYIRMDMKDGRGARLWKVCHAGNTILDKEEVDRIPFVAFVPLPVPHIFHGNNFAARVMPTQNARTVLTRGILDHTAMTTNVRWGVVKGGLLNPKEMLENKLGGIVNLNRPDAVKPLEQQSLNPFVFQTLEMLKANKEESTGISALSQGLNKDAISNQNSQGLVNDLVTLSQGRQKIIARNFAYGYLVPLYLEVYRLVIENEKSQRIIEVAGKHKPISVENWVERKECKVALHLGYGERDKQAGKIANAYMMLAKDPAIGPAIGYQHRYAMITDGMRAAGLENWAKYMPAPGTEQQAQPDPLKVKDLEIKDKQAEAQTVTAQASAMKNEKQAMISLNREMLAELKAHITATYQERDAARKDAETQNRIEISQREMHLLETAPPASEKAIVSPNS